MVGCGGVGEMGRGETPGAFLPGTPVSPACENRKSTRVPGRPEWMLSVRRTEHAESHSQEV